MTPLQAWLDSGNLFPLMPPPEQIAAGAAVLSLVSSLAMDSPLSMMTRIGAVSGS